MSKSISQLDSITDEAIDLSQFLAIDDPSQTFKLSLLQLRDFFVGQLYPAGSTMFRFDNRTPNECGFPGTWSKVNQDVSLHTAKSDGSDLGVATGNNIQSVPLMQHTHTASSASAGDHTHTASSASAGDHTHTASSASAGDHTHPFGVTMAFDGSGGTFRIGWGQDPSRGKFSGTNSNIEDGGIGNAGAHTHGVTVNSAGAHTHGVTVNGAGAHTHSITVDSAGGPSPTMDVRGARIMGHLWHRTA